MHKYTLMEITYILKNINFAYEAYMWEFRRIDIQVNW